MCGIYGYVGPLSGRLDLTNLGHRGPDSEGFKEYPVSETQKIILGHTRLAIQGLEGDSGSQPMVSSCGRYTLVFNGEIFNNSQIKKYLIENKVPVNLENGSDTYLLLELLIFDGISSLNLINGMWAFFFWDNVSGTGIAARDRYGEKPFYYKLSDGIFEFASEIKQLQPDLIENRQTFITLNNIQLINSQENERETLFKNIFRLKPGECLSYHKGQILTERWYDPLNNIVQHGSKSYEVLKGEWKELFLDSVDIRLSSEVPFTATMSSGLDSNSIIAAMMLSKQYKEEINIFTSDLSGAENDEMDKVKKWSKLLNLRLNVVDNSIIDQSLIEAIRVVEDPYYQIPIPMLNLYKKISDFGYKVVLDGHGADEQLIGYGHIGYLINDSADINEMIEYERIYAESTGKRYILNKKRAYKRWLIIKLKKSIKNLVHVFRQIDPLDCYFSSRFDYELFKLTHFTIMPTLLRNYDKYSMNSGVEVRSPFVDHRLVNFNMGLSYKHKLNNGYTKSIVRDSMRGSMSNEILDNKVKVGWNAPLENWLKTSFKDEIDDVLNSKTFSDYEGIADTIKKWQKFKSINPDYREAMDLYRAIYPYLFIYAMRG
ncbi:asparagine synthase (glutamine-hydrolyzing) [Porticoccaceae bacterium]|nr:asparagine synthase (glutamine-hydrolyzing) [Porticoccaceae bacterium]